MTHQTSTIWISGATGGIGSVLVANLHAAGWRIAASARSEEKLEKLSDKHDGLLTLPCDFRDPDAIRATADNVFDSFETLDAYVHLPGSFMLKQAHTVTDEEWDDTIELNLTSAFYALRAIVKKMQRQGSGALVFTSTVAARTGLASHEVIAAAKAGVEGMVRSAASSYASRNIRVNAVAPGLIETPLSEPMTGSEQGRKISERLHPLGRIGQPGEVAAAIQWLVSKEAAWVTGQIISVDGGLSAVHPRPRV